MKRILVVEDDSFFRQLYSDLLTEEGYEVEVASSGREALKRIDSIDYQLVVTDLVMPDISGLEILSHVKQKLHGVDVIVVTGNANLETAIYALKHGARDYLIKPVNNEEFKHAVSLCFEQRKLLDENQELKDLLSVYQLGQNIANCLDLDRLYLLILDALAGELGLKRGLGFFVDGDGELKLKELRGISEEDGSKLAEILRCEYQNHDLKSGNFMLLKNFIPSESGLDPELAANLSEALIMFINSKIELEGVVILFNNPGKEIPEEINYKALNFLLDQSSLAFENALRYANARNLLYLDELSGLFNYRYLDVSLEREIKRADRYGTALSLVFVDLDLFKQVNDTYGHLVGSQVLSEAGKLLKDSVREVDVCVRYGGDEFVIILVETAEKGASIVAERLRRSIESHRFAADHGHDIRLTACFGYACYPTDTMSKTDLLHLADKAMYQGKAGARNTVFKASDLK